MTPEERNRQELRRVWRQQIFTFPHYVTLHIRSDRHLVVVVGDAQDWLNDQGWRRGASGLADTDWGVDYQDDGKSAIFGFHDPDKAMLFKLTWSQYL